MDITHDHFVELALKSDELDVRNRYFISGMRFLGGIVLIVAFFLLTLPVVISNLPHSLIVFKDPAAYSATLSIPVSWVDMFWIVGLYLFVTSSIEFVSCHEILKEFKKANLGNYR